MQKSEVLQKFPSWAGFTIAEVPGKYTHSPMHVEYFEERLDFLLFFFNAPNFPSVLAAVKEKYPGLICEDSQVGNAMGATFTQTNCALEDAESILRITRFVSDIRTSSLSLTSKRKLAELAERSKQKKKDI